MFYALTDKTGWYYSYKNVAFSWYLSMGAVVDILRQAERKIISTAKKTKQSSEEWIFYNPWNDQVEEEAVESVLNQITRSTAAL